MKKIKLTQGKVALVDDEDFERVNQYKWYADHNKKRNVYVAKRSYKSNGVPKTMLLHQFIMGTIERGHDFSIDHINHDTLNNQKSNLRICNSSQNLMNQKMRKNNSSGYKGVSFQKKANKFKASIELNSKSVHIGLFNSPIEAALAYNKKALELFGEFAFLNKV